MEDIKRILVVGGIARNSRTAFHYGASLSRKYDAELFLIHVIHNPFGFEGWNLPILSLKKEYERIIAEARMNLDEIILQEKTEGLKVNELIREGHPTKEVLKVIEEHDVDLLILPALEESHLEQMASRMENLMFGRSNVELIRKMPCAILLAKFEP